MDTDQDGTTRWRRAGIGVALAQVVVLVVGALVAGLSRWDNPQGKPIAVAVLLGFAVLPAVAALFVARRRSDARGVLMVEGIVATLFGIQPTVKAIGNPVALIICVLGMLTAVATVVVAILSTRHHDRAELADLRRQAAERLAERDRSDPRD